jgi:BirA family biotin operon repressor/biotin-[acetyl-CoA-carboxylase] ligase
MSKKEDRGFSKDLKFLILDNLKRGEGYVSGEELAHRLKITRQSLWKHISKLQEKGYEIVAVPHLGYRLISSPDKLYPWEIACGLQTKFIGRRIYHFEETSSTQDIAWRLGLKNLGEGTLVVSERQKKGRGRLYREWFSPYGGIYFSLILKPDFILINEIPQIALLASLGCVYGIKEATGLQCSLKWPNDILIAEKKVGGILCELSAEQDRINFIILGVGINVNTRVLPSQATSLFLSTKRKFCRILILQRVLEQIEILYDRAKNKGFSSILEEWEKFSFLWGKRIKVNILDRKIEGEAVGIDSKGYLLLRIDSGSVEKVSAGDVLKVDSP